MDDTVAFSLSTYDRAAAPPADVDAAPVEAFLRRTGRPLPRVIVMGRDMPARCRKVEACGGEALGVEAAPRALQHAREHDPQGTYIEADARDLPVDGGSFDGAWTEAVFSHVPRSEVAVALASVHRALRPGGLLYARVLTGNTEGFEDTEHGPVYRARWEAAEFEQALSALDFTLLESHELPGGQVGLVFRREY